VGWGRREVSIVAIFFFSFFGIFGVWVECKGVGGVVVRGMWMRKLLRERCPKGDVAEVEGGMG
jgi:hypothetical protein